MDNVAKRIKEYALMFNPNLEDNALLVLIVKDVMNRALIYTNRLQLVREYEEYLLNKNDIDGLDATYDYDDGVIVPTLPIPVELETVLATVVVGVFRTVATRNVSTNGAIKSISDNGQSITYGDQMANFLNSSKESDVFAGSLSILDKFRLPSIHAYNR